MSSVLHDASEKPRPAVQTWRPGAAGGYAIAVISLGVATWVRQAIDPAVGEQLPFLTYLLAVVAVAWTTRLGPSLLTLFAGLFVAEFLFIEPRYAFFFNFGGLEQEADLLRYVVVSAAIIAACQAMRASRSRAEASTEQALEAKRHLEREVVERLRAQEALQNANQELEHRVRQRTAELTALNESLQRSNRELEQFAAVASHDLQEPLRKVQAFGDRLRSKYRTELGEQGGDYLERVLGAAARMRTLIDDLLMFSRVTSRAQPFAPVRLDEIAAGVVADLEGRALLSNGCIEVAGLPEIDADPLQMRQLFLNLIGNGLKFHRREVAPVVKVSSRVVPADESDANKVERCEILFEDNGIGFEIQYLDRIFEVFQRLHGRDEYEGTGIGLAICRKIVERHGGAITARSAPGEGSTFIVTLPMRQQQQDLE